MYPISHEEPRLLHEEILEELARARTKFPTRSEPDNEDLLAMLAALTEEIGEFNQAIIQWLYEPRKEKTYKDIRDEAVQVMAMVMRVMLDTKLIEYNPYGAGQRD